MESIGLPTISASTTGNMTLSFTYDNNSDLTQTDSTVEVLYCTCLIWIQLI